MVATRGLSQAATDRGGRARAGFVAAALFERMALRNHGFSNGGSRLTVM